MVKLQKYQLPLLQTFDQHFLTPFNNRNVLQAPLNFQPFLMQFFQFESRSSQQRFMINQHFILRLSNQTRLQYMLLFGQDFNWRTYWLQCQPLAKNQRKEMQKMLVDIQVDLLNITQSNKLKLSSAARLMVQESGCLSSISKKNFWSDVELTSFKENQFIKFHKNQELKVLCLKKESDDRKQIPQNSWKSLKEVELFFEIKCLKAKEK